MYLSMNNRVGGQRNGFRACRRGEGIRTAAMSERDIDCSDNNDRYDRIYLGSDDIPSVSVTLDSIQVI